ncbi:hypothetical protein GN316_21230 [Xylophilus sp. Kf1]|nr:hypothetical protein [Xylophilus sp. Kf1]
MKSNDRRNMGNCLQYLTAVLFLLSIAPRAQACKPGESIDIFFGRDSAVISEAQLQKLAAWTQKLLIRYPHHDQLLLGGLVEQGESGGEMLRRKRELSVRLALIDLSFTKAEVNVNDEAPAQPHTPLGIDGQNDNQSVAIDFLPGCPHECSCQKTWKQPQ